MDSKSQKVALEPQEVDPKSQQVEHKSQQVDPEPQRFSLSRNRWLARLCGCSGAGKPAILFVNSLGYLAAA